MTGRLLGMQCKLTTSEHSPFSQLLPRQILDHSCPLSGGGGFILLEIFGSPTNFIFRVVGL